MVNSSRIIENIINSVITGIISFFLPLILSLIYSITIGWNYKISVITVMSNIPPYVFAILFLPFCYWVIRRYIKRKMNEGNSWVITLNDDNYDDIDRIEYNDLLWIVQINSHTLRQVKLYGNIDDYKTFQKLINNLRIKSNPRCSKCGAELYFTQHNLWYSHSCVNPDCSFIKRTWQSTDKMRNIAKKQFKFKLETEFFERNG